MSSRISCAARAAVLVGSFLISGSAGAVDWAKVPAKKINLFYPAQASWERLFRPGYHSGQKRYLSGTKNCFTCHGDGDEIPLGDDMVHAEKELDPAPIPNKPGSIKADVKFAHDASNLYVRFDFDPGTQPNAGMDKDYETKVSMILDDGGVPDATRSGCFSACHDNSDTMKRGLRNTTMYLPATRTENTELKPADELAKMRADGHFFEYWQARLKPGAAVSTVDGTVLEKRSENPKPAVSAVASRSPAGVWTVTFARKLVAGAPYKDIKDGKVYNLGFAIHAGYTTQRYHYVSFERTLVLNKGNADFVAGTAK